MLIEINSAISTTFSQGVVKLTNYLFHSQVEVIIGDSEDIYTLLKEWCNERGVEWSLGREGIGISISLLKVSEEEIKEVIEKEGYRVVREDGQLEIDLAA